MSFDPVIIARAALPAFVGAIYLSANGLRRFTEFTGRIGTEGEVIALSKVIPGRVFRKDDDRIPHGAFFP